MSSQGFQCLACEMPHTEVNLPSLQKHFASQHGVQNLLSSPATQAVVRLSSCHADSCNQSQSLYGCVFCGGSGLQEKEMREHLGRTHGDFFKQGWKSFSTSHCSCFAAVHWGWGPVLNPAGELLKSVKKEDFGVGVEGGLLVGSKNNVFAFEEMLHPVEEMKKAADKTFKFSTNKIKTEMELDNMKAGREGLRLEENSSISMKEGLQETQFVKEGLQESQIVKEVLQERNLMERLQERKLLKDGLLGSVVPHERLMEHDSMREGLEEQQMLDEGLEKNKILEEGLEVTNPDSKVDGHQEIQSSLEAVRKEKSEIEGALMNLKSIHLKREELKVEKDELEDLRSEVVKAKKEEVTRKIKLGAVVVDALIDPKGKMRKYNFEAELEKMSSDLKGDGVEVVLKGSEHAVEKTDQQLKQLTSTYLLVPLKDSERSVVTAGEGMLLEQIRRMADAAIGYNHGSLYIFGTERERLEAKAVVKQELKVCTSSSWRRWSFLRKSSNIG